MLSILKNLIWDWDLYSFFNIIRIIIFGVRQNGKIPSLNNGLWEVSFSTSATERDFLFPDFYKIIWENHFWNIRDHSLPQKLYPQELTTQYFVESPWRMQQKVKPYPYRRHCKAKGAVLIVQHDRHKWAINRHFADMFLPCSCFRAYSWTAYHTCDALGTRLFCHRSRGQKSKTSATELSSVCGHGYILSTHLPGEELFCRFFRPWVYANMAPASVSVVMLPPPLLSLWGYSTTPSYL